MMPRFKLIAAALGLVVAGTIADATAMTVGKSVTTHTIAGTRTVKVVSHRPNRILIGAPIVRHERIVYRAPVFVRTPVLVKKIVRVTRGQHVARRVLTKTIVR